ncbi:hypothetical protein NECAME_15490 [Necator americanus]|uniref:Uncharacterized protein n=1 Tax=Necator americanus TaxID=51031 RepID=W2SHW3_NECAM|nr:hypothetical protein NECAME_15490 [Necator americanus]ETN69158.1 hypothetical protein NECAME_15490 [Necator americanus]
MEKKTPKLPFLPVSKTHGAVLHPNFRISTKNAQRSIAPRALIPVVLDLSRPDVRPARAYEAVGSPEWGNENHRAPLATEPKTHTCWSQFVAQAVQDRANPAPLNRFVIKLRRTCLVNALTWSNESVAVSFPVPAKRAAPGKNLRNRYRSKISIPYSEQGTKKL